MDLSIIFDVRTVDFRALRPLLNSIQEHPITASLPEPSSSRRVLEERVRALMALPIAQGDEDVGSNQFLDSIQDLLKEVEAAIKSRDDLRKKAKVLTESRDVMIQEVQGHIESRSVLRLKVQSLLESRDDLRYEIQVLLEFIHLLKLEVQVLRDFRHALRQGVNAANGQLSQLNMNKLVDRLVPVLEQYCNRLQDLDNTLEVLKDKLAHHPVSGELTQRLLGNYADRIRQREAEDPRGVAWGLRGSLGAQRYPETLEALKEVDRLRYRHESLETRVGQLEANKADRTQIQHLQDLLTAMGEWQIPDHVPEQQIHQRTLVDNLLEDKEKNTDVASDVNGVLLQSQADNERLHSTSRRLMEEHSEKQIHIDCLYKVLEKLDEKKADKQALESNMSCIHRNLKHDHHKRGNWKRPTGSPRGPV